MKSPTCETIRPRLSEFIEGDLPEAERRAAEDHLRSCAACLEEERALRDTLGRLRSLPKADPPPDMVARIERALDTRTAGRGRGRTRVRRHAVAMILVVGVLVGIIRVLPHGPGLFGDRRLPVPQAQMGGKAASSDEPTRPFSEADRAAPSSRAVAPGRREMEAASPPVTLPSAPKKNPFALRREAGAPGQPGEREEPAATRDAVAPAAKRAMGALTAERRDQAPYPGSALDLLRTPRSERAWAESIRRLITDRPADLTGAWRALTPEERAAVLGTWKRTAPSPDMAPDLDAAIARAKDPDQIAVLRAFRESLP